MDPLAIDRSLEGLSQVKDRWARLPIREKIRYLEQVRDLLVDNADAWVAAGVQLKGLDPKAPIVGGEEWLGGPYPTAAWLTDMIGTLTRLTTGVDPLEGVRIRTRPDGQVIAGVFPSNAYDRLLLNGYELDVWMQPGVTADTLRRHGRLLLPPVRPHGRGHPGARCGQRLGDPDAGRAVLPVRRRPCGRAEDEPGQ